MAMLDYGTGAGGARLSAIDEGEGSAILVVHPGGGDASSWSTVARLLADEFRVVRIQRRIYTPEASIALPHLMAAEAADILTIAGGLARPLLVGHSSGAVAALEAALASPIAFAARVPPSRRWRPRHRSRARPEPEPVPRWTPATRSWRCRFTCARSSGCPQPTSPRCSRCPRRAAQFARFAAAQIADNEALDALGVGIERYAALDLPAVVIEGDRSPPHLRQRLADLAATLPRVDPVVTLAGEGHIAHMTSPKRLPTSYETSHAASCNRSQRAEAPSVASRRSVRSSFRCATASRALNGFA
jgi:pimeloyl-ACP methyl ester carboxylesterase